MDGDRCPQAIDVFPGGKPTNMHRFYVNPQEIKGNQVRLDQEQSRHIEKVLRFVPGDRIMVFDGLGREYEVVLSRVVAGQAEGEIIRRLPVGDEPVMRVKLVQGIAKGDKMDFIIQKAVELGVDAIYPLSSQHAVVKLEKERALKKQERWRVIAREACKQCRRNRIPEVYPPLSLASMLEIIDAQPAIMLYENEKQQGFKELLKEKCPYLLGEQELFLIIGPEGGFAETEVEQARSQGVMTAGLGPRILRTETAGLAALTIVLYELADLG
ncbi:MAG TPA: 16S rRNA (uracil(1498)-N(3))-methyltransferase [Syntrophomonas sp.]|nr:16S rRNA (uracil(1498)-N(3))-methyltransferase [Syntrophomonas sp.]